MHKKQKKEGPYEVSTNRRLGTSERRGSSLWLTLARLLHEQRASSSVTAARLAARLCFDCAAVTASLFPCVEVKAAISASSF
jgi:hypothetical protein